MRRTVSANTSRRVTAICSVLVCVAMGASALVSAAAPGTQAQAPKNDARKAHFNAAPAAQPTVEEASKFLVDAEASLLDLGVKASHANWVQENFITEDTELIAADANQALNALSVDLAKKAQRFDAVKLPPVMARKMLLLKLAAGFPAPGEPAEQKELAQVLASLNGDYGRGKWCPDGANAKCLDVTAVGKLMS